MHILTWIKDSENFTMSKKSKKCYAKRKFFIFFKVWPRPLTLNSEIRGCARLLWEPSGFGVKLTSMPSLKLPKYCLHQNVIPQKFWKQVKLRPVNTVICIDGHWALGNWACSIFLVLPRPRQNHLPTLCDVEYFKVFTVFWHGIDSPIGDSPAAPDVEYYQAPSLLTNLVHRFVSKAVNIAHWQISEPERKEYLNWNKWRRD